MTTATLARLVLESLPQAISAIDAEGRFVFANAAFWQDVDVTPEACPLGSSVRDVVRLIAYRGRYGPGDPEAQVAAVMAIDRTKPTRRLITMPDASRSLEIISVPLADGGYINIGHDVTALVHAREEQAARARLLESTLAQLRSGVVRFDEALRVSVCNPTYDALVGLPGGSVRPGMMHRDIVGLLDRHGEFATSEEAQEVLAALERNRAAAGTRERRRPSGEVLRFDTQPTRDGGCLVEATDITALKNAEDEARRRAAQLDGMLAALPHGVCVYGPDRRVQMLNAAYQRLIGDDAVSLGARLEDVIAARLRSGEYDAATAAAVLARFAPPTTVLPPMRRQRPNGLVLENCMARMPDGGVISVFTDVTALHQAEEAARQRAAMLDGVLEALPHGVCVYGGDRRVAMVNEAYRFIMAGAPIAVGDHIEEIAARRIAPANSRPSTPRTSWPTP
jgi:PAS domain-containing protein